MIPGTVSNGKREQKQEPAALGVCRFFFLHAMTPRSACAVG
jgi:hypothetical protein